MTTETTNPYTPAAFNYYAALEEARRLTFIALTLDSREASLWLTREALDLLSRIVD